MSKTRKDSWTSQDDYILAQTILQRLNNGGTQIEGFDEAGGLLRRSSAACGFRWNSVVRKNYESQIKGAKASKHKIKKTKQITTIEEILKSKDEEIATLKQQLAEARKYPTEFTLNEDYKALLRILETARRLGKLDMIG